MDAEQEIVERAEAWQRAIEARDPDAAGAILAADYALVVTHPARAVMPRDAWLALLPEYVVTGYEVESQTVDVRGDFATVAQRVDQQATVRGDDRSGPFVLVDVWTRADGEWRVWRRFSTPLTAGELRA